MCPDRIRVVTFGVGLALALGGGPVSVRAQEPAEAKAGGAPSPVTDLATRFQLVERYGTDDLTKPEAIGQYRVAIRDTIKVRTERPQGAPERSEFSAQTIYSERAAKIGGGGVVQAAIRSYEALRLNPDPMPKRKGPRPLEGLTLWYQANPEGDPRILSLTEGRGLKEDEATYVSRHVFMPNLVAVLPILPLRIGDRWSLSRAAARALLGEVGNRGTALVAQLEGIHHAAKGTDWEAIMTVSGHATLSVGDTGVNARIVFTFAPPAQPAEGDEPQPRDDSKAQLALGAITELRMATSVVTPLPESQGRFKKYTTREVVLARQLAASTAPLAIPDTPPTPTEENSWLTYDDPQGAFHFRHPQDLRPGPQTNRDVVELLRNRSAAGPDRIVFLRQHRTGDSVADKQNRDPEFLAKTLEERWKSFDILRGPAGWLPDADWAPAKMKVYRVSLALRGAGAAAKRDARIHDDNYLVLFGRDDSLVVESSTVQDPPSPFRTEVEAIIKTVQLGPTSSRPGTNAPRR